MTETLCAVTQSCPLFVTLRTLAHRLLCPWDFPCKNAGLGCHFYLYGIFLTQASNPCLLHRTGRFLTTEPPGTLPSPIVNNTVLHTNLLIPWTAESRIWLSSFHFVKRVDFKCSHHTHTHTHTHKKILCVDILLYLSMVIISQFTHTSKYAQIFIIAVGQLLSRIQLSAAPWTATHQAFLSFTTFQSLLKLMSIESVMPSNHFVLCWPLLLLPSIFLSIKVFASKSALGIRCPEY